MEGRIKVISKTNVKKPTLLLADDHAIVLDGLRRLLEPEFDVVGAVGDGWALLEAAVRLNPDVIVADISMPLLNGIEALGRLKKVRPWSRVVILSMHGEVEIAAGALRAGASAYVLKNSAAEALSHAIWEVLGGRIFVSPKIAGSLGMSREFAQSKGEHPTQLTQREREVLQLVAEGRTIRGISSILKIASRTVVFHKSNIMDKVGRRTTADLTQYAIQTGMIDIRTPESERVYAASA
jgi:DNA-binding NarL/FixJ family response regulator